jgi:peptidoglycan/xylan/chitin deacetylase (PgdA/CDA1 family)
MESILDTLDREETRCTFFLQGRWVETFPEIAARVARDGHLIGNHSFYHARMPLLTDEGFVEDVRAAERVIVEACGTNPKPLFRCPFGVGGSDPRTTRLLGDLGYRHVGWDLDVEDWEPRHSGDDLANALIKGVQNFGDGTVVLLHSWPTSTGHALGAVINGLRDRGYQLVDVAELAAR